jgi:hypothetical protein
MADHTTLTQCLMLVNKRAALLGVALKASFVSAQESKPAGFEVLLNVCRCAFHRDSLVRVVAIGAAHFAFQHRMVVRQLELRPHFQVTLETGLRIFPRIDDRTGTAAGFNVQTARPVARLAAHVLCVLAFRLQSRVRRCPEVANNFFVASLTLFRADELRTGNTGWRENCPVCGAARKQNHGQRDCSPGTPQNFLALTVDPSS